MGKAALILGILGMLLGGGVFLVSIVNRQVSTVTR
jgi:hypothetical protein